MTQTNMSAACSYVSKGTRKMRGEDAFAVQDNHNLCKTSFPWREGTSWMTQELREDLGRDSRCQFDSARRRAVQFICRRSQNWHSHGFSRPTVFS